jgi:hypothetical protein
MDLLKPCLIFSTIPLDLICNLWHNSFANGRGAMRNLSKSVTFSRELAGWVLFGAIVATTGWVVSVTVIILASL